MKSLTNASKILILITAVMVFSGLMFFPIEVDAKKSAGTYLTEIGSQKVCGIKLCDVPLSIEEKISSFLGTKKLGEGGGADQQIGRFSDSGVLQQSAGTDFQKPAQKASGTYLTEIGSKNVCGDKLCDVPLSIEEKISAFLDSKKLREGGADQQSRFSEGGVFLN